jgi:hypothetical protein
MPNQSLKKKRQPRLKRYDVRIANGSRVNQASGRVPTAPIPNFSLQAATLLGTPSTHADDAPAADINGVTPRV